MADELIIVKNNNTIYIKSLDRQIFNDRVERFKKDGYSVVGKIEILSHGLCKATLKKI
ncbi:MAG: hypothetical protein VX924_00560 [Candidatus Neomarinimicrobiota bacterium]|nr:hypothetical protein [Candidatus Neomarinimicrobiota bacterium]MEC7980964.1 hypothetical protein [Candidatus Neomarinimicrobiota bacterium]